MRGQVNHEFIVQESIRKKSYAKRSKGMLKQIDELTTLCDIDAFALVYSEFHPQPLVWPSSPSKLQRMITKFRNYSQYEQGKKMMNQESFLKERIRKAKEQLTKVKKKNKEKDLSLRMFQLMANGNIVGNMNSVELNDMQWIIDENLKHVNRRIIELDNKASTSEIQAQVTDPMVADGAVRQVEAQVNHGQSYDMNMNIAQDFTSFLSYINGRDNENIWRCQMP